MRFLREVEEKEAPERVKQVYAAIKRDLESKFVPLMWQLVANYEDYLEHVWKQVETNLAAASFAPLPGKINEFADKATVGWVGLSPELAQFAQELSSADKKQLLETVDELTRLNAVMTLISIAIRENMKGLPVGVLKIAEQTGRVSFGHEAVKSEIGSSLLADEKSELSAASKWLAPLTGGQLAISRYAKFFDLVGKFMDKLIKTETYLGKRVELERVVQELVKDIPYPLETTYKQFMELTQDSPKARYIPELIFLLHDLFPAKFPHLVFTSSIMKQALEPPKEMSIF